MSHKVLPLDGTGYGRVIGNTARGALLLHRRLTEEDWGPFRIAPLPAPDINIVCFGIGHPDLATVEAANDFVSRVYQAMSVGHGEDRHLPDYFVTRTVLRADEYGASVLPVLEALRLTEASYLAAGGLGVIRCTVMDPFVADHRGGTDHIDGFARNLRRVLEKTLHEG
jgi:hypothetical protein